MSWGHPNPAEHLTRIVHLDRMGVPYPEHTTVGTGAVSYSCLTDAGEAEIDLDPDLPASTRSDALRVHLRTHAETRPVFDGEGAFCLEVFTPGPSDNWLYTLYPRINGRLMAWRNNSNIWVVTIRGRTFPNRHLGTPVEGFTPDGSVTMMNGATFHFPSEVARV
jgi:hypothetical protein